MKLRSKLELLIFLIYFPVLITVIYLAIYFLPLPPNHKLMAGMGLALAWVVIMVYVEQVLFKYYGVEL